MNDLVAKEKLPERMFDDAHIARLLDRRHATYIEWDEPAPACGVLLDVVTANVRMRATVHDCISMARTEAVKRGKHLCCEDLLISWLVTHYARCVEMPEPVRVDIMASRAPGCAISSLDVTSACSMFILRDNGTWQQPTFRVFYADKAHTLTDEQIAECAEQYYGGFISYGLQVDDDCARENVETINFEWAIQAQ